MSRLVFLDTETTGLDPDQEEVFEIAAITQAGIERVWTLEPHRETVDFMHPRAAEVNRYHERTSHPDWTWDVTLDTDDSQRNRVLADIAATLDGAHIVGAAPDFDTRFLTALFNSVGRDHPRWHYHLIDIESVAIGYLRAKGTSLELPWNSEDLSRQIGVNPPQGEARHTALADARWVGAMWTSMGLNQEETA